jgi:molybdate transport system substrate-binding protein
MMPPLRATGVRYSWVLGRQYGDTMQRLIMLAALLGALSSDGATAAELKMLSPGATSSSLNQLLPRFEQSSGHKVTINYGPVGGLVERVKKDEAIDLVVVNSQAADELRKLGKLADASETLIATVGIGVFVRKGDPKPDISTVEAFARALANAKAIAYSDANIGGGSAAVYLAGLMASLDITGSIKPKTKLTPPSKPLADLVASGAVDFGLNQITEVLADPRLELVGPLPKEIQNYTRYVANPLARSQQQEITKTLMVFLTTPDAKAVMKSKGFE